MSNENYILPEDNRVNVGYNDVKAKQERNEPLSAEQQQNNKKRKKNQ